METSKPLIRKERKGCTIGMASCGGVAVVVFVGQREAAAARY